MLEQRLPSLSAELLKPNQNVVVAVADAMAALWQDLRSSLRSRIRMQGEMIAAVACGSQDSSDGAAGSANIGAVTFVEPTALPRRVLIDTSQAVPGLEC